MSDPVHPLKLVSLLLQYPDEGLLAARAELAAAAEELPRSRQADAIRAFARFHAGAEAGELQQRYVDTFDFARRNSLYLTYHTHGDRRQRGMALLSLKQRFAAAGLPLAEDAGELPDFLPLLLEFAVLAPEAGLAALERHRESLELLRASLHADASPWAALLDAVVAPLPGLSRAQAARVRELAKEGPPDEQVGLEPFAPPETMPEPAVP